MRRLLRSLLLPIVLSTAACATAPAAPPVTSMPSAAPTPVPTPAAAAALDPDRVLGIVTARGSATAHAAILARALGLPAVVGLGDAVLEIADGTTLLLDGDAGTVTVDPDPALIAAAIIVGIGILRIPLLEVLLVMLPASLALTLLERAR